MTEAAANVTPPPVTAPPPKSDPSHWGSKVPPAVAAAAARADELHKAVYAPELDEKTGETPPEGTQEPQGSPPAAETKAPAQPTGEAPAAPQTTQQRDWERDYNAMKGRWERSEEANKSLAERLQGLEAVVASLKTKPAEAKPTPAAQKFVTDEDEKDFGADFLSVVGKKAKEELYPEIQALKEEITYLKGGVEAVGQNVAMSSRDKIYNALSRSVPNWVEMNNNGEFLGWLDQIDPYAGRKRREMLTEAFDRHDAPRVVNFFRGYLSEAAVTDPQNPPRASASPAPNGAAQGKVPLASFAAPGRAGPAAPSSPADKPVYTRAQVAQFYLDKSRGRWQGRDAEFAAIDADIIAAGNEGRIR